MHLPIDSSPCCFKVNKVIFKKTFSNLVSEDDFSFNGIRRMSHDFFFLWIKMASNSALKNKIKTVEEPTEKQEMWIFTNTECQVDNKVVFTWNTLFQAFYNKEIKVLLQDDPSTELSKSIYMNISKFGLHWEATKTRVLTCSDVIEWIT